MARHAFIGIFYGALWWRLGLGRISERVGLVFFSLVFVTLGNQQNIPKIFQDRLLFYREKGAGVYGASPYWWSIVFGQVRRRRGWMRPCFPTIFSVLIFAWAHASCCGQAIFPRRLDSVVREDIGRALFFSRLMLSDWCVCCWGFCSRRASAARVVRWGRGWWFGLPVALMRLCWTVPLEYFH